MNIKKRLSALILSGILLLSACDSSEVADNSEKEQKPKGGNAAQTGTAGDSAERAGTDGGDSPEFAAFPYSFTAEDVYGNTVTQADLGDKKVYFVHYWATWCPPCVGEMSELAELARDYGDRVGFIGLLDDYDTSLSDAVGIIANAGVPESFIMVDAHEPSVSALAETVDSGALPTTVIIADGAVVSEQIVGAQGEKYAEYLDKYLR